MKSLLKSALLFLAALSFACAEGDIVQSGGDGGWSDSDTLSTNHPSVLDTNVEEPGGADVGGRDSIADTGGGRPDIVHGEADGEADSVELPDGASQGDADASEEDVFEEPGCTDDGDCPDGRCHDVARVCVASCCTFTVQDPWIDVGYVHNRFDIAVTEDGVPALIYADTTNNRLYYAQPVQNQWFTQLISSDNMTSVNIRLGLDSNQDPHVILGRYQTLKHFWRDDTGWQHHDLRVEPTGVSYVDIATDGQGGVHMIALLANGGEILYSWRDAQGTRGSEVLDLPAENNAVWTNLVATSDGRPIASFQIGLDRDLYIAERDGLGDWYYEKVRANVSQVHALAVGPDDQPRVAFHLTENDGLRLLKRQSGIWQEELVVAGADDGFSPDIAVDALGDPHFVYQARTETQFDNPMRYVRWDGGQWENKVVDGVERAFYPRIVVDGLGGVHAAVYDPRRNTVSYVKIE
ncbi:MAG: hypothetical protein ACNA8W_06265 [Bradymonadaceae bacterium]